MYSNLKGLYYLRTSAQALSSLQAGDTLIGPGRSLNNRFRASFLETGPQATSFKRVGPPVKFQASGLTGYKLYVIRYYRRKLC